MQYRTLGRTGIKVSPLRARRTDVRDPSATPTTTTRSASSTKRWTRGSTSSTPPTPTRTPRRSWARRSRGGATTSSWRPRSVGPMGDDPNQHGNSRRWIITEVEHSLRRLQTDHIDLYQIHRPDPDTDIEETLSALSDLIHSGKVRAIGSSTMPASDIVEAQWVAERRGLERFRTEQPPYSILNRGIEREVLPLAQRYGMGMLVWGPLGQGMLTGRVRKGQHNDLRRAAFLKLHQRRAPARCRREARPARRGGGPADDAPRDGVRDRAPRRDQRAARAAHDGPARRPRWPASTSLSATRSSTGSTRSSRPAPMSARSTRPTCRRPSRVQACAAGPSANAAAT